MGGDAAQSHPLYHAANLEDRRCPNKGCAVVVALLPGVKRHRVSVHPPNGQTADPVAQLRTVAGTKRRRAMTERLRPT